jgi:hypothetical protein
MNMNFSINNPLLKDLFKDYWNHFRVETLKKPGSYDTRFSFDEKEKKLNTELRKEILKRANVGYAVESNVADWFTHPLVQYETFAVSNALVDMILPDSIIESIGIYTDIRNGAWGDSFAFDVEARDLFVVSKSGKAQKHSEIKKQYKGQVTVIPEWHQITVGVNFYNVLSGKESLANFVMKAARSIETQMTLDTYTVFATAMTALDSTTTTGLRVSGFSQANLVRLCEQVSAWSLGAKPIVMGTQLALVNILPDDANYRYYLSDPYAALGYMPTAFGYDVMKLNQVADLTTPFGMALANDRLWIVAPASQKIVKLCIEGNTLSNTTGVWENADLTQSSTLIKSYKPAVATNAIAAVITL